MCRRWNLSLCRQARDHPTACQTRRERKIACHSPMEVRLRVAHSPFVLGGCPEMVSPSLRIHSGLGVAMELALSVIGQMTSRSWHSKPPAFSSSIPQAASAAPNLFLLLH